jgi:hypothetical protein
MVLKYLVPFLAISSVYGQRLGADPKTWSPSVKHLTCEQCISVVNRTETAMSSQACRSLPAEETAVCNGVVSIALELFTPEVVCQEIGYCPKKLWLWLSF